MNASRELLCIASLALLAGCVSAPPPAPVTQSVRQPAARPASALPKPNRQPVAVELPEEIMEAPPRQASARGRVLFLGDSFSIGAFGRTFDQALRDAGFEVFTSVSGGGSPYYWLAAYPPVAVKIGYWERTPNSQRRVRSISAVPKLETLLAKWDPDIVVVQTGTNLYSTLRSKRRTKEANAAEVGSLLRKMGGAISGSGARVYWITPATASTNTYPQALQDEMLQIFRSSGGAYGQVFDSYAVTTAPPAADGIHLGPTEARAWAQRAAAGFAARF